MPKIVIATTIFEDNRKFGYVVAGLGVISLGLYLASLFILPDVFSLGIYQANEVFLLFFYIAIVIFAIFFVAYLIKFGYAKKLLEFVKSGKLREITEQVKGVKQEFEAIGQQFPKAQKTFENLKKIFTKGTSAGVQKVPTPSEVAANISALLSNPHPPHPADRGAALQMIPMESPPIMVIPKTRAPVNDVPRVAFVGHPPRAWHRLVVLLISLNIMLVLGIILVAVLTGAIMGGL